MANRTFPDMPADPSGQEDGTPAAAPGVLVHTRAERYLATQHWLLSTLPDYGRDRARMEWQEHGITLLPLGTLFAAIRLPGPLVQAVSASTTPADVDAMLGEALQGGPVICDRHRQRYYALVPASVPRTWQQAIEDWRAAGVAVFGRGTHLGVPWPNANQKRSDLESYWSVPMDSPAMLCAPLRVARLIADGHRQLLAQTADQDAADHAAACLAPVTGLRHDARQ
ncbi:hypothetical protein [Streptomyces olivochromogenes]|uniref:hypothetical protein n=1 Tax=Streptomyces olivochromogenes TaxID=1963 RepID=UPI001F1D39EB|nr:hypothetical protein [Streptomyces olivochromogenes]MCF3132435.1 hypothetical protein [Streptomyces olivochromogenes]